MFLGWVMMNYNSILSKFNIWFIIELKKYLYLWKDTLIKFSIYRLELRPFF